MSRHLYLCDAERNKICDLFDRTQYSARNDDLKTYLNQISELSFSLPLKSEKNKYILNENLVLYENEYYIIKQSVLKISSDGTEIKEVLCKHCSDTLASNIVSLEETTPVNVVDLMKRALCYDDKGNPTLGWKVGDVTVDRVAQRGLEATEESSFSILLTIAEKYEGALKFNSQTMTVDMYPATNSNAPVINLRFSRNMKGIEVTTDSTDLYTRLYCYGCADANGNDTDIMDVNPTGMAYIENFDYFKALGYTDEQINANKHFFIRTNIWRDDSYYDTQELYDQGVKELAKCSVPIVDIKIEALSMEHISGQDCTKLKVGDCIRAYDMDYGIDYLCNVTSYEVIGNERHCPKIEVTNALTYRDTLSKMFKGTSTISKITTSNGEVKGSKIDNINVSQIGDLDLYYLTADEIKAKYIDTDYLKANYLTANEIKTKYLTAEEIGTKYLTAQEISTKYLTAQEINSTFITTEQANAIFVTTQYLEAKYITAEQADIKYLTFDKIEGKYATLEYLKANYLTATDITTKYLTAEEITTKYLTAEQIATKYMTADKIKTDYLTAKEIETNYITAKQAEITYLKTDTFNTRYAEMSELISGKATITDLNAAKGKIDVLESQVGTIDTIINRVTTSDSIHSLLINADTAVIDNAFFKNLVSTNIKVQDLLAGDISTTKFKVTSDSGNFLINDNTLQVSDAKRVRVQIGKDGNNDYSLSLWDEAGNLIWDARGLKAEAIKDAIIRNDMVASNANIDGSKLNISSVVTQINNGTTTINANHILYDGKSLDVAFNTMQTSVSTVTKTVTDNKSKWDTASTNASTALTNASTALNKSTEALTNSSEAATNASNALTKATSVENRANNGDFDGKGVKGSNVTYQASTSGTSAPTGTWSATVPSVSAGQYLWTRTIFTYTDNTTTTTYIVTRMGTNGTQGGKGDKGDTGNGITSITPHYLASASATGVTTSTTGWTTTPQSTSSSKRYLWSYQTINYTSGTPTTTVPAIVGVYGDTGAQGATGATGKGINSVTPQYYLSTSSTAQTGGSWVTAQPAYVSGRYYWTRDAIVWSDNTTTYTTPTLAAGLNSANANAQSALTQVTTVTETVNTHTTKLTAQEGQIGTLISDTTQAKSDITAIRGEVTTAKGNISSLQTNYSNLNQTVSGLSSTVGSHSSQLTTIKGTADSALSLINGLEIGGRNYYSKNTVISKIVGTPSVERPHADAPNGFKLTGVAGGTGSIRFTKVITSTGYWTVSFWVRGTQNLAVSFMLDICDTKNDVVTTTNDNTWKRIEITQHVTKYTEDVFNFVDISGIAFAYFLIKDFKVEKGTKATDYTPAPEDVVSDIATVDGRITAEIKTVTDKYTSLEQNVDGFKATVSNTYSTKTELTNAKNEAINSANTNTTNLLKSYATTSAMNSAITQKANEISQTVSSVQSSVTTVTNTVNNNKDNWDKAGTALTNANNAQTTANSAVLGNKVYTATGVRKFMNVASFTNSTATLTGAICIQTPVINGYMTRMHITGYNYLGANSNIDVVVSVYMINDIFYNYSFNSYGNYPITKVRVCRTSSTDKRIVVILNDVTSKWNYPKLFIESVEMGHSVPPDTWKDGFSMSCVTTLPTGYTGMTELGGMALQTEITNTKSTVAQHTTSLENITSRVSTTETDISKVNDSVTSLANRVKSAEQKITDNAIVSTVTNSTYWTNLNKTATDAQTKANNLVDLTTIKDTRSVNNNPQWYFTNYPRKTVKEFKTCTVVGISGEKTYGTLETSVSWPDTGGGYPTQLFYPNESQNIYRRVGTSATAWGAWTKVAGSHNIVSTINQTAESVKIDASKIELNGKVTFSMLNQSTQDMVNNAVKRYKVTVDLTSSTYATDTFYPVIGTSIPYEGYKMFECNVQLNSGSKPSWSTHASGFTCNLRAMMKAGGWGTVNSKIGWIEDNSFVYCDQMPAYIQQMFNASQPVFFLRGGAKYHLYTDYACTWIPKTETYTASQNSVSPIKLPSVPTNYGSLANSWDLNTAIANWCYNNDKTYINGGKIYTGTITASQIASNTITANKLAAKTLTAASGVFADACITNANIANLAVNTAKIADASITNAKIANVDAAKITTGYLNAARIQAGTITADKLCISQQGYVRYPSFTNWTSTFPFGAVDWQTSTSRIAKVSLNGFNVVQMTTGTTQTGLQLTASNQTTGFFSYGLNLDGVGYVAVEIKFRLTSGTNPTGAGALLDFYYKNTAGTSASGRITCSLNSLGTALTVNTWYTYRMIFAIPAAVSTGQFSSLSGFLMGNYTGCGASTSKTIQFASFNVFPATYQDYLTQTWTSGTSINGASIKTGTIEANKLKVTTLSSITANIGNITAGSINIGSGKFVVDSSGNLTANNATMTGTVNATGGKIGNFFIKDGTISSSMTTGTSSSAAYMQLKTTGIEFFAPGAGLSSIDWWGLNLSGSQGTIVLNPNNSTQSICGQISCGSIAPSYIQCTFGNELVFNSTSNKMWLGYRAGANGVKINNWYFGDGTSGGLGSLNCKALYSRQDAWIGSQYSCTGWLGFYNAYGGTRKGWIGHNGKTNFYIYNETGGDVYIANSSLLVKNDASIKALNTSGGSCHLVGISSSNNVYLGDSYGGANDTNIYGGSGISFNSNKNSASYKGYRLQFSREQSGSYRTILRPWDSGGVIWLGSTGYRFNTGFFTNAITASDLKEKKVLTNFDMKAKDFIMALKPIAYNRVGNGDTGKRVHYGFGAQTVAQTIEDMGIGDLSIVQASIINPDGTESPYVKGVPDEQLSWGINYNEFIAPTIAALQSTIIDVDNHERRIQDLERENAELRAKLNAYIQNELEAELIKRT